MLLSEDGRMQGWNWVHTHLLCSLLLSDLNTEAILLDLVNSLGDKHWEVETLKSPIPFFTYNH